MEKNEEARFFKPENYESLKSFKENTIEWKEAYLWDLQGNIKFHFNDTESRAFFKDENMERTEKLKEFLSILNESNNKIKETYKTIHKYFYSEGIKFENDKYNLLRLNPPFMLFRNFSTDEGLVIVNIVTEKERSKKMALAIFYDPEYTAPCVLFYLRNFLKAYNKENVERIKVDDPFNRYSGETYLTQVI